MAIHGPHGGNAAAGIGSDLLSLSTEHGPASATFHYTADSPSGPTPAALGSPGTTGFMYSVPSPTPTPTPPHTSLRLNIEGAGAETDAGTKSLFLGERLGFAGKTKRESDAVTLLSPLRQPVSPVRQGGKQRRHSNVRNRKQEIYSCTSPKTQEVVRPGLFAALLDNISLSQLPSQGTEEGAGDGDVRAVGEGATPSCSPLLGGVSYRSTTSGPDDAAMYRATHNSTLNRTNSRCSENAVCANAFLTPPTLQCKTTEAQKAAREGGAIIPPGMWSKCGVGLANSQALDSREHTPSHFRLSIGSDRGSDHSQSQDHQKCAANTSSSSEKAPLADFVSPDREEMTKGPREPSPRSKPIPHGRITMARSLLTASGVENATSVASEPPPEQGTVAVEKSTTHGARNRENARASTPVKSAGEVRSKAAPAGLGCKDLRRMPASAAEGGPTTATGDREHSPACSSLHLSLPLTLTPENCKTSSIASDARVAAPVKSIAQDRFRLASSSGVKDRESTDSCMSSLHLALSPSQQRRSVASKEPVAFHSPLRGGCRTEIAEGLGSERKAASASAETMQRGTDRRSSGSSTSSSSSPWSLRLPESISQSPRMEGGSRGSTTKRGLVSCALDGAYNAVSTAAGGSLESPASTCEDAYTVRPSPRPACSDAARSPAGAETAQVLEGEARNSVSPKRRPPANMEENDGDGIDGDACGGSYGGQKGSVNHPEVACTNDERDGGETGDGEYDDGMETECEEDFCEEKTASKVDELHHRIAKAEHTKTIDAAVGSCEENRDEIMDASSNCATIRPFSRDPNVRDPLAGGGECLRHAEGLRRMCEGSDEDDTVDDVQTVSSPNADAGQGRCVGKESRPPRDGVVAQTLPRHAGVSEVGANKEILADMAVCASRDGSRGRDTCIGNSGAKPTDRSADLRSPHERAEDQGASWCIQNMLPLLEATVKSRDFSAFASASKRNRIGSGANSRVDRPTSVAVLRDKVVGLADSSTYQGGARSIGDNNDGTFAYFTQGAAAKGKTNWDAGVCGREDVELYAGEGGGSGVSRFTVADTAGIAGKGIEEGDMTRSSGPKKAPNSAKMVVGTKADDTQLHFPVDNLDARLPAEVLVDSDESTEDVEATGANSFSRALPSNKSSELGGDTSKPQGAMPSLCSAPCGGEVPVCSTSRPTAGGWLSSRRPALPKSSLRAPTGDVDPTSLDFAEETAGSLSPAFLVPFAAAGGAQQQPRDGSAVGAAGRGSSAGSASTKDAAADGQPNRPGNVDSLLVSVAKGGASDINTEVSVESARQRGAKRDLEEIGKSVVSTRLAASGGSCKLGCGIESTSGLSSPTKSSDMPEDIDETPPTSIKKKRLKARNLLARAMMLTEKEVVGEREDDDSATMTEAAMLELVTKVETEPIPGHRSNFAEVASNGPEVQVGTAVEQGGPGDTKMAHIVHETHGREKDIRRRAGETVQTVVGMDGITRSGLGPSSSPQFPALACARALQPPASDQTAVHNGATGKSVAETSVETPTATTSLGKTSAPVQWLNRANDENAGAHRRVGDREAAKSAQGDAQQGSPSEMAENPDPVARSSREERASKVAAWYRWNGARERKISALTVKLKKAQKEKNRAETDAVSAEVLSLRNEVFKYEPSSRCGSVTSSSLPWSKTATAQQTGKPSASLHPVMAPPEPPPPTSRRVPKSTAPWTATHGHELATIASTVNGEQREEGLAPLIPPCECPAISPVKKSHSTGHSTADYSSGGFKRGTDGASSSIAASAPSPAVRKRILVRDGSPARGASGPRPDESIAQTTSSVKGGREKPSTSSPSSHVLHGFNRLKPTTDDWNDPIFRVKMKARAQAEKLTRAHGMRGEQPAAAKTRTGAIYDSGRDGADRQICGGGNGPAHLCNSDDGWLSSRRRDRGLDSPIKAAAVKSKNALSRSKSAPAGTATSPCRMIDMICEAPDTSRSPCAKMGILAPSLRGKDKVQRAESAKAGREKRRIDLESEHDMDTIILPNKKTRTVEKGRTKLRESASLCEHKSLGHASDRLPAGDAVDATVVSSKSPSAELKTRSGLPRNTTPQPLGRKPQGGARHPRRHTTAGDNGKAIAPTNSPKGRSRRGQQMVRQAGARLTVQESSAAVPSHLSHNPDGASTRSTIFVGISFVLAGFTDVCKHRDLERAIVEGGGRLLDDVPAPFSQCRVLQLTPPAPGPAAAAAAIVFPAASTGKAEERGESNVDDVVVVVSHPAASMEINYVLAIATGTPLVHHLWVVDSVSRGQALPAAPYLLPGVRETSKRRQAEAARAAAAVTTNPAAVGQIQRQNDCGSGRGAENRAVTLVRAVAIAQASVAKVVAKPGTPLNGMSIGVAHPCAETCRGWATVLKAAGAHIVRQIPAPLHRTWDGESLGLVAVTNRRNAGSLKSPIREARAGDEGIRNGRGSTRSEELLSIVAGLDCVLCDYPGVWSRDTHVAPSGGSPVALSRLPCRTGLHDSTASTSSRGSGFSRNGGTPGGENTVRPDGGTIFLGEVVAAARREGVRVVSLSWAVDCVIRGARIKWQLSPQYLTPFSELSSANPNALPANRLAWNRSAAVESTLGVTSSISCARRGATSIQAFVSRDCVRYEVNDHVRFNEGTGKGASKVCNRRLGQFSESSKDECSSGIGRIISLERAQNGRVVVVLEPLKLSATSASKTARSTRVLTRRVEELARAGPSMESSVARGRARRAKELLTTITSGGCVGSSRQKIYSSSLGGKVTVVTAQEFDDRRGYCGRDPDVFVRRALPHS